MLTMDEYIKKSYAVDAVLDVYYDTPDIDLSGGKFEAAILKIPVADVVPVRHGRWKRIGENYENCTYCGYIVEALPSQDFFEMNNKFCRMCGAKMDLED